MKPLIARMSAPTMGMARTAEETAEWIDSRRLPSFRLALAILARADLAEDVAQEALIRAHRAIETLRTAQYPEAWLRQVVVRCAMKAGQKGSSGEPIPDDAQAASGDRVTQLAVQQVLSRLSAEHRAVLALAMFEQLSYHEIGETLGVPVGTVASRLNAAKQAFRRLWEDA